MDFTDLINTFGWIAFVVLGLGVMWGKFQTGADDAAHQSNEILRGLIDDQNNEILRLRDRMHNVENILTAVSVKNEYLEKLMSMAIAEYFVQHPEEAKAAKSLIESSRKT